MIATDRVPCERACIGPAGSEKSEQRSPDPDQAAQKLPSAKTIQRGFENHAGNPVCC
jgi:hypothetical protein